MKGRRGGSERKRLPVAVDVGRSGRGLGLWELGCSGLGVLEREAGLIS